MGKASTNGNKAKRTTRRATPVARPGSPLAEHLAASKRVMKHVLASKENSVAFLVEAGILNKSGKGLAKPYR